jgi:hypothetical protein
MGGAPSFRGSTNLDARSVAGCCSQEKLVQLGNYSKVKAAEIAANRLLSLATGAEMVNQPLREAAAKINAADGKVPLLMVCVKHEPQHLVD